MDKQRAKIVAENTAKVGLGIPAVLAAGAAVTALYPLLYATHLAKVNKVNKTRDEDTRVKPKPFFESFLRIQGVLVDQGRNIIDNARGELRDYDHEIEQQKENERAAIEQQKEAERAAAESKAAQERKEQERQARIARETTIQELERTGAMALMDAFANAETVEFDFAHSFKAAGLLYNAKTGEVYPAPKESPLFKPDASVKPILVIPDTQRGIVRTRINEKRKEIQAQKLAAQVAVMQKVIAENTAVNAK